MTLETMYEQLGIDRDVLQFGTQVEKELKERFACIDENVGVSSADYGLAMTFHSVIKDIYVIS